MARTIEREELRRRLDEHKELVLIEVLSEQEYQKAHIKGAVNIPFQEIGHQARERFDPQQTIVVYCADRQCQASPIAAQKLEQAGFRDVWEYRDGKQDWQQAGYPGEGSVPSPGGTQSSGSAEPPEEPS